MPAGSMTLAPVLARPSPLLPVSLPLLLLLLPLPAGVVGAASKLLQAPFLSLRRSAPSGAPLADLRHGVEPVTDGVVNAKGVVASEEDAAFGVFELVAAGGPGVVGGVVIGDVIAGVVVPGGVIAGVVEPGGVVAGAVTGGVALGVVAGVVAGGVVTGLVTGGVVPGSVVPGTVAGGLVDGSLDSPVDGLAEDVADAFVVLPAAEIVFLAFCAANSSADAKPGMVK